MRFEGRGTQFCGPGRQCPVRPVPTKTDYAISGLGDDAGHWFLVGMATDPRVLECRANVVFHRGTHLLISGLIEQQAGRRALTFASNIFAGVAGQSVGKKRGRLSWKRPLQGRGDDTPFENYPQGYPEIIHRDILSRIPVMQRSTWSGPRRIVLNVAPQLPIQIGKSSKPLKRLRGGRLELDNRPSAAPKMDGVADRGRQTAGAGA